MRSCEICIEHSVVPCVACRPTNSCLDDLCIIAAMLSVEEIFHFPKRLRYNKRNNFAENKTLRQQEEEDDQRNAIKDAHDRLRHKKGDHFTYLKIFKKYDREGVIHLDSYDYNLWLNCHINLFVQMESMTGVRRTL